MNVEQFQDPDVIRRVLAYSNVAVVGLGRLGH